MSRVYHTSPSYQIRPKPSPKQEIENLGGDWEFAHSIFSEEHAKFARDRRSHQFSWADFQRIFPLATRLGKLLVELDLEEEPLFKELTRFVAEYTGAIMGMGTIGKHQRVLNWELHYIYPALMAYTNWLTGSPKWSLIDRVVAEHMKPPKVGVFRWWRDAESRIADQSALWANWLLESAALAYVRWSQAHRYLRANASWTDGQLLVGDSWYEHAQRQSLDRKEREYIRATVRLFPQLASSARLLPETPTKRWLLRCLANETSLRKTFGTALPPGLSRRQRQETLQALVAGFRNAARGLPKSGNTPRAKTRHRTPTT